MGAANEHLQIEDPIMPARTHQEAVSEAQAKLRRVWLAWGFALAIFTILFNVVEGGVAVPFGFMDSNIAVISFGIDSFVEVISAVMALVRLCKETKAQSYAVDTPAMIRTERIGAIVISLLLFVLALFAIIMSVYNLATGTKPDSSPAGLIIACVSLGLMGFLYALKSYTAIVLDSATLEADAACTFGCIGLSVVLFIGSLVYMIWPGLWFVPSIAAIIIAIYIIVDGALALHAATQPDFTGCGCQHNVMCTPWVACMRNKMLTKQGVMKRAFRMAAATMADTSLLSMTQPNTDLALDSRQREHIKDNQLC